LSFDIDPDDSEAVIFVEEHHVFDQSRQVFCNRGCVLLLQAKAFWEGKARQASAR